MLRCVECRWERLEGEQERESEIEAERIIVVVVRGAIAKPQGGRDETKRLLQPFLVQPRRLFSFYPRRPATVNNGAAGTSACFCASWLLRLLSLRTCVCFTYLAISFAGILHRALPRHPNKHPKCHLCAISYVGWDVPQAWPANHGYREDMLLILPRQYSSTPKPC